MLRYAFESLFATPASRLSTFPGSGLAADERHDLFLLPQPSFPTAMKPPRGGRNRKVATTFNVHSDFWYFYPDKMRSDKRLRVALFAEVDNMHSIPTKLPEVLKEFDGKFGENWAQNIKASFVEEQNPMNFPWEDLP